MAKTNNLTAEERIRRVEMAPVEVQTRVAKAFLRDDIEDENVQYLFNTDTLAELNDPAEDAGIENIDAQDVEGIGAGNFFIRTTKPSGNKNFITTGKGGWNTCIQGYPTDSGANVLANCVGYASGRFNEIINEARGTTGCTYKYLNCNAENFIERAQSAGLKTGSTPRVGAIGCAMKGSTLNGGDGAGHVWIVEKVNSSTSTYTSESGYGGTAFWNQTRSNSNGRWGLGSGYTFRAYIYLPDDVQKIVDGNTPAPAPTPGASDKFNIGDKVVINGPLYVNSNAAEPSGSVSNKTTTITRKDESSISKYNEPAPTPTPAPTPAPLAVGDTVKIVGTGNGSSYGNSNTAYGIGWTRQILRIWDGRPFPYQVGNGSGTTGFYKAEALQRK